MITIGIKKIVGLLCVALFVLPQAAFAQNNPVNIYLFYGDGCPHCAQERQYIVDVLQNKYSNLKIYEYEIYNNKDNAALLQEVAEKLGVGVEGVPFLIIGDQDFVGYAKSTSAQVIEQKVKECSIEQCNDSVASIVGVDIQEVNDIEENDISDEGNEKIVSLPLFGKINALSFSLPIVTIIMGMLDGFNPCAMWTLLFLISLLLGIENRRRMWLLGITFIVASASVYFLFMSAWLNLILFLGLITWIRILIGVLALVGGGYSVKEFIRNKNNVCKVTKEDNKQKTFEKLKLAVQQNSLWLALGGIVVLAFAVNLIELICSAGLPAVYTQVLALSEMHAWRYYFYILLYIFFFMLDDLLVFSVAMITLKMTGITTKYARASRLVGGLVMLAIGAALILKPELLMFG